jgi:hypothetical protein
MMSAMKVALADAIVAEKDRLARGHWKTDAEGKKLCGVIEGLEKAGALLTTEYEKFERLEDDERSE